MESTLDFKAARSTDVFKIDATVSRGNPDDRLNDFVDILGIKADRNTVDSAEILEQQRLALHHRKGRDRANVSQTENGGAIGDNHDGVGLPGMCPSELGMISDSL